MSRYQRQSQFELFPSTSAEPAVEEARPRFSLARMTLSLENLVLLAIVMVMTMVISYSLGVDRGRKTARLLMKRDFSSQQAASASAEAEPQIVIARQEPQTPPVEAPRAVDVPSPPQPAAEPEQAPAPEIEVENSADSNYTIQVASFRKEASAEKEAEALRKKGYEIFVVPKGKHSIVCVGKFSLRDEAKTFSVQLKKKYKDCLIRRL